MTGFTWGQRYAWGSCYVALCCTLGILPLCVQVLEALLNLPAVRRQSQCQLLDKLNGAGFRAHILS